ncbi:MAG: phosphatidate cytidylyltransferase [Oscillospiraceae bacterium]|jgi:phosphatidate cytidylyltransferase|nr:phosphatidate cytidylyltransferase [Oscillospiraceae bacterium]
MKTRIITAAVAILILSGIIAASIFVDMKILYFTLTIVAIIATYEMLSAINIININAISIPSFICVIMIQLSLLFSGDSVYVIIITLLGYALSMFICAIVMYDKVKIIDIAVAILGTLMVAFPIYSICVIYWREDIVDGLVLLLYCLMVSWLTDSGAYFAGTFFGKHKMSPLISPKKTIEGAMGGVIAGVFLTWLAFFLSITVFGWLPYLINTRNMIIVTFLCSIISIIGDLSFSLIKRSYDIKDYGRLLPGHGGILDRFDSVFFVCPAVCILNILLPVFVM